MHISIEFRSLSIIGKIRAQVRAVYTATMFATSCDLNWSFINHAVYVCFILGPAPDASILGYYAQEDPELCQECASQASDSERGSRRRGQHEHRPGGDLRQAGGQGRHRARLSAENVAARADLCIQEVGCRRDTRVLVAQRRTGRVHSQRQR